MLESGAISTISEPAEHLHSGDHLFFLLLTWLLFHACSTLSVHHMNT